MKERRVKLTDLETLLLPKEEINEIDHAKKDYFTIIDNNLHKASKLFKRRDIIQCN